MTQCRFITIGSVFDHTELNKLLMAKKKDKIEEESMEEQATNATSTEETDMEAENGEKGLQEQYEELNRKYLLLYSDFDNFRKRSIKEKADIISTASGEVIKDVLVVLDDFERAIANNENVEDAASLKEGFQLIHTKLLNILASKGLEAMDAKGETFDADKHEAITQIPAADDQKGKVVDVVERGYNLRGSVLRYAKVVVGQ